MCCDVSVLAGLLGGKHNHPASEASEAPANGVIKEPALTLTLRRLLSAPSRRPSHRLPLAPPPPPPRFSVQIIFHKDNPGIDYEFYVPVEKKEEEREPPRERPREHQQARAPLRSKCG